MRRSSRTRPDTARAVYVLPLWLIRAVKFDAARQGVPFSRLAESILARGVSPDSRKQAQEPVPEPAAAS